MHNTHTVLRVRRTPSPSPFLCPPPDAAPCLSLSFPPFRGYLRFDSPYLPSHPQLHRPFSRIPRLGPYPENYLFSLPLSFFYFLFFPCHARFTKLVDNSFARSSTDYINLKFSFFNFVTRYVY
ncbi:hypothetical protein PUN28_011665 [Cardiocondyla obscurior]|uniref:Uncharacterized protein n=1 Tax=Cardiocondyla obscurior TaxID=286306 RepID=A0AAW2FGC9_9HYME